MTRGSLALHLILLAIGIAAPFLFPAHMVQFAVFWIFVLFALTWDTMGGQMGYNSLGNIVFFGLGMYICAVVQIGLVYNVGDYTASSGEIKVDFTDQQYYTGLALGVFLAAIGPVIVAAILSWILLGLRGPYFAIGTLGVAIAVAELTNAWGWVGGGMCSPSGSTASGSWPHRLAGSSRRRSGARGPSRAVTSS
jgi:branched-chain amino acid transport system permease protein